MRCRVGMHLLEHFVHVDGVTLLVAALVLLAVLLCLGHHLLGALLWGQSELGRFRHDDQLSKD